MAEETRIPSAFRDALDEPAPPVPPESEPERGDDDGGHIQFVHPVVMLLSNGGVQTAGWKGTLIQGWCVGASLVTAVTLGQGFWGWLSGGWPFDYRGGLFVGALMVGLTLAAVDRAIYTVRQPDRWRRTGSVIALVVLVAMLVIVSMRVWLV